MQRRFRPRFQDRLTAIALIGGAPAVAIAVYTLWRAAPTPALAVIWAAIPVLIWGGCALWLRRRLMAPLQTLANLVEAVRHGDYALRGRHARRGDVLGEVLLEVNALGSSLQQERLATLEGSALLRAIVEELDSAVFAFDPQGVLRICNRAAAELLGRSAASATGQSAAVLGLAALLEPLGDGGVVRALSFPARSGRFELRRREFREQGLPHALVIVSDLSRALRDEERRAWQRLIRVVGHEINNSLAPIRSLAQTLHDTPSLPRKDVDESLRLIGDRADSLTRFVASYSQLARMPAPQRAPISLAGLLARLIAPPEYHTAKLVAPHDVIAEVDAGQLEQALLNLLKNAFEASGSQAAPARSAAAAGAGGSDGEQRESKSRPVELRLTRTRDGALIEVLDSGLGVANPDNLFVPFFTTKPGGSGIGLTLSRQIVEAHGGVLTLENRADARGCVARIRLPIKDVSA